ncbi:homeobox protein knotted-1-like protein 2 [Cinnamomum micranthum f. kanehirae]|uniref:Homeobox protein knotted-1-like protein 2 n=1 Tax=Cinnamomum micranthum f. kanehirae TaxID=337451 RepID=A0A3S4N8G6_9MAGN|nr:homeobox protein knotted-1-like protein 2 [Cinnamomum micranthum f. kanehirae]
MDDYSQLSENTSGRGSFIYASPAIAPNSSVYARSSNSPNMQQQQQQQQKTMPLNSFHQQHHHHNQPSGCFLSDGPSSVKTEGGSSQQQLAEFHYPLVQQQQQGNGSSNEVDAIKAKIINHPQYCNLLEAYMDCQKVGAPPEVVARLAAIGRELESRQRAALSCRDSSTDPELDQFMEAYYDMLVKYRDELTRPLQEAMEFMRRIESQLSTLTNGSVRVFSSGISLSLSRRLLLSLTPSLLLNKEREKNPLLV